MTSLAEAIDPGFRSGRLPLTPRNRAQFRKKLIAWFLPQKTDHPWRKEVDGRRDPYLVWVSEIMLQQTTIGAVTPKYHNFIEKLPTVERLAAAGEGELRPLVQGLGYYRRFNLLHKAAKQLVASRPAADRPIPWPTTFAGWRELPGVGDYTAAAVSSFAFAAAKVALDGNGERILQRLLASSEPLTTKGKALLKGFADSLLGSGSAKQFNEALMELGQKVCIRKIPRCDRCPVTNYCQAFALGRQNTIPIPPAKAPAIAVSLTMVVPFYGGSTPSKQQVGLRVRSARARFLKGRLGFATCIEQMAGLKIGDPAGLVDGEGAEATELQHALSKLAAAGRGIGQFSHAITKHKIRATVRLCPVRSMKPYRDVGFTFVELRKLKPQLEASLDIKTMQQIIDHLTHHPR